MELKKKPRALHLRFIGPIIAVALLAVAAPITGCSVGMALSGSANPDLGAVRIGATRGEIEIELGNAIYVTTLNNGNRIDIYEYEIGNEPSTGRAIGHAAMDVLTVGIWEVIGTPIEGVQGEKYHATVTCDQFGTVIAVKTKKVSTTM